MLARHAGWRLRHHRVDPQAPNRSDHWPSPPICIAMKACPQAAVGHAIKSFASAHWQAQVVPSRALMSVAYFLVLPNYVEVERLLAHDVQQPRQPLLNGCCTGAAEGRWDQGRFSRTQHHEAVAFQLLRRLRNPERAAWVHSHSEGIRRALIRHCRRCPCARSPCKIPKLSTPTGR